MRFLPNDPIFQRRSRHPVHRSQTRQVFAARPQLGRDGPSVSGSECRRMFHPTDKKAAVAGRFELTRSSIVISAADGDSTKTREALEHLCTTYWYPLYAFVRREGYSAHEAQDLTQEFFARLLEKNWLDAVDREKGKFRSFLFASMRYFLANEWDRANGIGRGTALEFCERFLGRSAEERGILPQKATPVAGRRAEIAPRLAVLLQWARQPFWTPAPWPARR